MTDTFNRFISGQCRLTELLQSIADETIDPEVTEVIQRLLTLPTTQWMDNIRMTVNLDCNMRGGAPVFKVKGMARTTTEDYGRCSNPNWKR